MRHSIIMTNQILYVYLRKLYIGLDLFDFLSQIGNLTIDNIYIFSLIFTYILQSILCKYVFRCKSFQTTKRGEMCRIPGSSVSPMAPGTPTPIRLPQVNADVFRQFMLYIYTGKVSVCALF